MQVTRERAGRRLAVLLTGAVAVLSLVTGVANLGGLAAAFPALGRLSVAIQAAISLPESVRQAVALTGAFTGFAMLASAWGLRRGLRSAWYSTVVLLPVTAVQGIAQSTVLSVPLVVLSLLTLPVVLANRERFTRRADLGQSQLTALVALGSVLLYGTVGTYALRSHFHGVADPLDAFYYTVVTASTVGYGDITPTTRLGRTFALSLLVVGTAGFAVALGVLLGPAIEARFTKALGRMTQSELELLADHVLVLGYGDLTEPILTELRGKVDFLVVTDDAERATELGNRGYDVLAGDPSDEETLARANIADARAVVVASNDDADDALSVLTASHLNPDVLVVAAATELENVPKLKRAGAKTVVSPASIGGHMLVESALGNPEIEVAADRILDESETDE